MAAKQFDREYIQNFEKLLTRATEENTPYSKTIAFLQSKLDGSSLKSTEFTAQVFSFMAGITNTVTENAMNIAMTMTDKELKLDKELELLQAQVDSIKTDIADKQYVTTNVRPQELLKLSKDIEVAEAQRLNVINDTSIKTAQSIKDLELKNANIQLVLEQIESEDKKNAVGGLFDQEIAKALADIRLIESKTRSEDKQNAVNGIIDTTIDNLIKDGLVKDQQILESQAKVILAGEQIVTEQKKNATDGLVDKQIAGAGADILIKTNQASLISRQEGSFDDNLKVEKVKALKDAVFGYAVSGAADEAIVSAFNSAIAELTA